MKRTRGENNRLRTTDWQLFEKDVLSVAKCKIIKTAGGPEPSYSYRPGGEGLGFESETNVLIHLYEKHCLLLFNKPVFDHPGTYIPHNHIKSI
jgi:hypothetical protein